MSFNVGYLMVGYMHHSCLLCFHITQWNWYEKHLYFDSDTKQKVHIKWVNFNKISPYLYSYGIWEREREINALVWLFLHVLRDKKNPKTPHNAHVNKNRVTGSINSDKNLPARYIQCSSFRIQGGISNKL